jgi:hypothetical protein
VASDSGTRSRRHLIGSSDACYSRGVHHSLCPFQMGPARSRQWTLSDGTELRLVGVPLRKNFGRRVRVQVSPARCAVVAAAVRAKMPGVLQLRIVGPAELPAGWLLFTVHEPASGNDLAPALKDVECFDPQSNAALGWLPFPVGRGTQGAFDRGYASALTRGAQKSFVSGFRLKRGIVRDDGPESS